MLNQNEEENKKHMTIFKTRQSIGEGVFFDLDSVEFDLLHFPESALKGYCQALHENTKKYLNQLFDVLISYHGIVVPDKVPAVKDPVELDEAQ